MTPYLAQLPDTATLAIGAVVLFIIVCFGAMIFLRSMRELRAGLADELKRELDGGKKAAPVAVQQPLVVKPHTDFVTKESHDELKRRVNECATSAQLAKVERDLKDDLTKQARSRKEMHEEIAELQGDVKVLKAQNEHQTAQLGNLDSKMDQVLLRLPRKED